MRFQYHNKYPKNGGVDYQAFQREELHKYSVTRFSDGKVAFTDRRPRRDSKYYNYNYLIWDLKENCQINLNN